MQVLHKFFHISILLLVVIVSFSCSNADSFSWEVVHQQEGLSFRGISAVNDSVCWVSGTEGTVLITTNGGDSWQDISIAGADSLDFRDIEAFDEQTAVAMSAGPGATSQLYKTVDGGKSWQKVHQNNYEEGFYDAIAFWDTQHGILQGDPIDGRLYILVTSDGGESWSEIPLKQMPDGVDGEYGFAASGTHLTVQGDSTAWLGTGGSKARVFKSTDRGSTWTPNETPVISGSASTGIFSLAFRDGAHGVAVGGDYTKEDEGKRNVAITNDGGESWELVAQAGLDYRSGIRYVASYYIVVGPSGSDYSADAGENWAPIEGPGFHAVSVGEDGLQSVWASGADGRIAKLVAK